MGNTTKTQIYNTVREDFIENANFAFESTKHYGFKNVYDIASVGDLWSWTRLGLVPLVLRDDYEFSEDISWANFNDPTVTAGNFSKRLGKFRRHNFIPVDLRFLVKEGEGSTNS